MCLRNSFKMSSVCLYISVCVCSFQLSDSLGLFSGFAFLLVGLFCWFRVLLSVGVIG